MKPCPTCGGEPAGHIFGDNWLIRCSKCHATNGIVVNDEGAAESSWDSWVEWQGKQKEDRESAAYWRKEAERLKNENRLLGEALLNALHTAQHGQAPRQPLAEVLSLTESQNVSTGG